MMQKDKLKISSKMKVILHLIVFLAVLSISFAIPVPHGIDGNIYDLDGITPAGEVDFSVNDTITGEYVRGKTRSSGYYSVSLNGDNGDTILISTWNERYSSNRTISLNGVMHNVDLLLNMSPSNYPPVILTDPLETAFARKNYEYDVDAFDADGDSLEYKLVVKPGQMHVGKITGRIKWHPLDRHVGNHTVVVEVSDGNLSDIQTYTLTVYPYVNKTISNASELSGTEQHISFEPELDSAIEKITLSGLLNKHVDIIELSQKPLGIPSLSKTTLKYFEITNLVGEDILVEFKVDKRWLAENDALADDILLNGFNMGVWEVLTTRHISSTAEHEFFEAISGPLQYFAISLAFPVGPGGIKVTGPREQFSISGIIYQEKGMQVESGTEFLVTNRNTQEAFVGNTGFGPSTGSYYVLVFGTKGDIIDIEVKGYPDRTTRLTLDGDIYGVDIFLNDSPLIPGFGIILFAVVTLACILLFYIKKFKGE